MFTVCKVFSFDAAHQLPLHDGKCRELHGHTYRVEVAVTAPDLIADGPKSGMVLDFAELSNIWDEYIKPKVDHTFLNDSLPVEHTTAENIAAWILSQFDYHLAWEDAELAVQVWETPTSWAAAT